MSYDNISIITVTNRSYCINNLIENFLRQNIKYKELIIIINNNTISPNSYNAFISSYDNIQLYKLDENITLGSCLNFAINKCKFPIIAKFDDDDYYGPFYLNEVLDTFNKEDCHIVGKNKTFVYFEDNKKLMIKKIGIENSRVGTVLGHTLSFKKDLTDEISFRDLNIGEDRFFCNDALKKGYKIYSTSVYNHIVFKHKDISYHTFKYDLDMLMKICSSVKNDVNFEDCFTLVDYNE